MYARDNAAGASTGQQLPADELVEAAGTALRMLADPTRLRIVWLLRETEMDVAGLAAATGAARPAVSQHLAKLRLAGLLRMRREGRRAIYTVRGGHVRRLIEEVVSAAEHHLTGAPDHD
ncbi:ArsR family transcriptional regulator [Halopolyspora algeriensis]|uniref:ArsR family transcriptional regulator n=1 Tax=Halopolyspora algeriensis TaxID=1500506 RepID=A0A368VI14_9ACTN|nr:metalloregulator ArsR/SmtB family transcription factor [Halopolyspora algeriensis]RCW41038.1 ArsR family transcriptional regulator [Halopolyspora algeriensis]TQM53878.1 ArsR family transcriptional regulator [Halopolyspora algeriensis]